MTFAWVSSSLLSTDNAGFSAGFFKHIQTEFQLFARVGSHVAGTQQGPALGYRRSHNGICVNTRIHKVFPYLEGFEIFTNNDGNDRGYAFADIKSQ